MSGIYPDNQALRIETRQLTIEAKRLKLVELRKRNRRLHQIFNLGVQKFQTKAKQIYHLKDQALQENEMKELESQVDIYLSLVSNLQSDQARMIELRKEESCIKRELKEAEAKADSAWFCFTNSELEVLIDRLLFYRKNLEVEIQALDQRIVQRSIFLSDWADIKE